MELRIRVNHPWTNGQVERMNRTIKDATVKRFHYDGHDQLRRHLDDFIAAYNFARRLKRLRGLRGRFERLRDDDLWGGWPVCIMIPPGCETLNE